MADIEEKKYRLRVFGKANEVDNLQDKLTFKVSKTWKVDWDKPIENLWNKLFGGKDGKD